MQKSKSYNYCTAAGDILFATGRWRDPKKLLLVVSSAPIAQSLAPYSSQLVGLGRSVMSGMIAQICFDCLHHTRPAIAHELASDDIQSTTPTR